METRSSDTLIRVADARRIALLESAVREHLEQLLHSSQFDASTRSREFLRFIVEEALAGHGEHLSQDVVAVAVFGRKGIFDATLDPIVRVQAGRLRRSLEHYYLLAGDSASIRIELPKGSYAPSFVTAATKRGDQETAATTHVSLVEFAPYWPTVFVHPFECSADDAEWASRMTDELAMELCRYRDVHVVHQRDTQWVDSKQQASMRFEFRGRLRTGADGSVIGARLVDRTTGEQVWSNDFYTSPKSGRWSCSNDDIPRVIAARIGADYGIIARTLTREHRAQRAVATDAFSVMLRCHHFFFSRQVQDLVPALAGLQHLTASEPEIPMAWTYLAHLYLVNYSFECSTLETPIDKAIECAYKGVFLDPGGVRARCTLATALLVKGELHSSRDHAEQALRLNPESLTYLEVIGCSIALAGDWERGMLLVRDATQRNPYCLPHVQQALWADHLRHGEFERAYAAALEYFDPSVFWRDLMIACCLGHLGRLDEAQTNVVDLLRAKPDFPHRGRALIGYYIKSAELCDLIVDGLRKVGLTLI